MEIKVPSLGESVTEATVARWLKNPGEAVEADEPLVELETDKVTLEVGSPLTGYLGEILAPKGSVVAVGSVLGSVSEGSGAPVASPGVSPSPAPESPEAAPRAMSSANSPAARKIMEEQQMDPQGIQGTGKEGRITKQDVLQVIKQGSGGSLVEAPSSGKAEEGRADDRGPREHRVPLSRLRQRIAERLKQAQNTAAILTTFNEIDMTQVMALREKYRDSFEKKHGIKLGFMSFFVKACVLALKEIPAVNAEIQGNEIVYKNYYDLGVAVGTPQGLVVPILRDADLKSFADLEKDIATFGAKAKEGKLTMEDLSGGTFTLSNGGTYGSLMSTPILNPPQSGILGMHKVQKRPVVIGNQIEIRPMMYVALSYDHRIIDGREAVTFLVRVKEFVEDPERLLLGM